MHNVSISHITADSKGLMKVIEQLQHHVANFNFPSKFVWKPLKIASSKAQWEIFREMLYRGADVHTGVEDSLKVSTQQLKRSIWR